MTKNSVFVNVTAVPHVQDGQVIISHGVEVRHVSEDQLKEFVGKTVAELMEAEGLNVPAGAVFFLDESPVDADHVISEEDADGLERVTATQRTGSKA